MKDSLRSARAGQHYAHSLTHRLQMKLHVETDPSEVLDEIIYCTRKARAPPEHACTARTAVGYLHEVKFARRMLPGLTEQAEHSSPDTCASACTACA
jgi:hypothetical protein